MKKCNKCLNIKLLLEFETDRKTCKVCRAIQRQLNYESNKVRILNNKKKYRTKNKDLINSNNSNYYETHKNELLFNKRSYYIKNKENKKQYYLDNIEHITVTKARYAKRKASSFAATSARRRALKLQATPSWLDQSHKSQIESIYSLTRLLTNLFNIKLEVDHIVPLRGVNCRGLHVPWNLQILTKSDNCSKGNRYG